MMGPCESHQKPRSFKVNSNKFNASTNNNINLQKNFVHGKGWAKVSKIIDNKINNKINPYDYIRRNKNMEPPKRLIDEQSKVESNQRIIQNRKIIRNKINLNPDLNKKKITKLRNPSQAHNFIKDLENKQVNIHIIKDNNEEKNNIQPAPLYQTKKGEENLIKINNRNASVINRELRNDILQKIEKVEKFISGTIGLINIGNTCYFNSAIQNLKNVFPLTLYLLKNKNFDRNGFTFKYCELLANLINQDTYQWFDPRDFLLILSKMAPLFAFGQQNDSNYCILYILTLLEKETRIYIGERPFEKILISSPNFCFESKKKFSIFMDKFYEKKNSCITDIFYGFQEDIYKCNYCSYTTFNFQGFSVLNIPIMKRNNIPIYSLEEGINYFQGIQNHNKENGFICQNCKFQNISTQTRIIHCPKIFIIHFKRIGENNFYSHNVKIPFEFGMNNLVDGKINEYSLIGFIKHYGGGDSGHNIAICKNFFDSKWYEYDDSRVTYINNSSNIIGNEIDTNGSFLFFYSKKNSFITVFSPVLIIMM